MPRDSAFSCFLGLSFRPVPGRRRTASRHWRSRGAMLAVAAARHWRGDGRGGQWGEGVSPPERPFANVWTGVKRCPLSGECSWAALACFGWCLMAGSEVDCDARVIDGSDWSLDGGGSWGEINNKRGSSKKLFINHIRDARGCMHFETYFVYNSAFAIFDPR